MRSGVSRRLLDHRVEPIDAAYDDLLFGLREDEVVLLLPVHFQDLGDIAHGVPRAQQVVHEAEREQRHPVALERVGDRFPRGTSL